MVIGVTGSSGSGKTTVSEIIGNKYNMKVINSDKVVRELSVPNSEFLNAIKENLGAQFFFEDGNLNKRLLAFYIYNDDDILQKLNKITYDIIVKEIINRVNQLKNKENVVIDVPLFFESGLNEICNHTISVIANRDLKIERISKRDNISEDEAIKRLDIQPADDFYIEKSDFIIKNNENTDLEKEVKEIIEKIIIG